MDEQPQTLAECKNALDQMANPAFTNDMLALVKSRYSLIYLTTNEERRMLQYFRYFCRSQAIKAYAWDCYLGILDLETMEKSDSITDDIKDPEAILDVIINKSKNETKNTIKFLNESGVKGHIYILLDFFRFLSNCSPEIERRLKTFTQIDSISSIIITGPHYVDTPATEDMFALLDFPYPNKIEIANALYSVANNTNIKSKLPGLSAKVKLHEEELVKAASGLTLVDAQSAFAKSIVLNKDFHIPTILKEKQQKIKKTGILDYFEPTVGMDDIGGLSNLVSWVKRRKAAFHSKAEEYGLRSPRGVMLLGIPGCGKSLSCKAIASEYNMPLLRLDFGRLFGSLVGESERTAREAVKLAEAISPCITGDTIIELKDNSTISAEELFRSNFKDDINTLDMLDGTVIIENIKNVYLNGYDFSTGKKAPVAINAIIRRPAKNKKILQITTDEGKKIKVTEDHKILIENNGEKIWKIAKELKEGDNVISF